MIRVTGIQVAGLVRCLAVLGVCPAIVSGQPADAPPRLGLTVQDGRFVDGAPGVIVTAVAPGSPASRARSKTMGQPQPIRPGDMVVGFDGDVVEADGTFANRVAAASGLVELVIQARADRQLRRLLVDLPPMGGGGAVRLPIGITVRRCDSGMHVEAVEPGSAAATARNGKNDLPATIAVGSHLLSINGQPVRDPAELVKQLAAAGDEIHVEIEEPESPGETEPPIVLCVIGPIARGDALQAP